MAEEFSDNDVSVLKPKKRSILPRIIYGVVTILMGAAFILLRNHVLDVLGYVVGGLFLISGAATIIAFCVSKGNKMTVSLIAGVVESLFGILFLVKPNIIADIAIYIFAAIIFVSGTVLIYIATQDKKFGIVNWKTTLIFGIVLAALGALMLCFIKQDKIFIAVLIGVELIVSGVLDIIAATFK